MRRRKRFARRRTSAPTEKRSAFPAGRRGRRRPKKSGPVAIARATAVIFLLVLIARACGAGSGGKVKIPLEDFAAFRIPSGALTEMCELSEKYGLSFPKLVAVYGLDNRFSPPEPDDYVEGDVERKYILNYDKMDEEYPQKKYEEYYRIIGAIFSEVKIFPIPTEYTANDYMFGNSFGAKKIAGETGTHKGTDIIDRENTRGRISVQSMTDGYISDIGWNKTDGYFASVETYNGTLYYYAHFDSLSKNLKKDDVVSAGQLLGTMGISALSKDGDASKSYPVGIHIGISPKTSLTKKTFWINPYCVLKYAEWKFAPPVEE